MAGFWILAGINAPLLLAGDLNPPVGPVAPTMKTLQQVEPRTDVQTLAGTVTGTHYINAPGSYYLTDNILGEPGKNGIEIDASNVTLDLRSFALIGIYDPGTSGVIVLGMIAGADKRGVGPGGRHSIAVYNGSVEAWGSAGIDLVNATNSRVERIRAWDCNGDGIAVGFNSSVTECHAETHGSAGIRAGNACTISGCTALFNDNGGIRAGNGSSISGCVAASNTYGGIFAGAGSTMINTASQANFGAPALGRGFGSGSGFETSRGCTFANCTADENSNDGFNVQEGCNFANCAAHLNSGSGFNATDDVNISHCSATQNGFIGMWVNGGTISDSTSGRNGFHGISSFFQPLIVKHCNTSVNGVHGILLDGAGGRVEGCAAFQNGEDGINVANGCIVTACTAHANTDDGIQVNATCTVTNNTCYEQRGAGAAIHVVSNENRIDGNHCVENDRGLKVDVGGNVIIHNSASGNGAFSYVLANGNDVGPIGSAAASTSPWANIGVASAPTCSDGVQNGSETDVDCGGSCPPCANGQGCIGNPDCVSGNCVGNVCQP
jgi:parallel beta-helix repeat protein